MIKRLSRPVVGTLARDPASGRWGRADRHPDWETQAGVLVAHVEGPLFYANAMTVKDRVLALAAEAAPEAVVLDMSGNDDLDLETLDMLGELADALSASGVELRLASVHAPALELLRRSGVAEKVRSRAHVGRRRQALKPAIASPTSFAPMTRQSTAMITALCCAIHVFSRSRIGPERSPSAK